MKILKKRTDSEVYHLGIDALVNNFGTTGTARFLNQIQPRTGNYTLERHEWLDKIDRKTGLELIRKIRKVNIEVEIENKRIAKLKTDICGICQTWTLSLNKFAKQARKQKRNGTVYPN